MRCMAKVEWTPDSGHAAVVPRGATSVRAGWPVLAQAKLRSQPERLAAGITEQTALKPALTLPRRLPAVSLPAAGRPPSMGAREQPDNRYGMTANPYQMPQRRGLAVAISGLQDALRGGYAAYWPRPRRSSTGRHHLIWSSGANTRYAVAADRTTLRVAEVHRRPWEWK